jgi:hypothetical protein
MQIAVGAGPAGRSGCTREQWHTRRTRRTGSVGAIEEAAVYSEVCQPYLDLPV